MRYTQVCLLRQRSFQVGEELVRPTNSITSGNGWYALKRYACGVYMSEFNRAWSNDIGATDIMFTAALQGQDTRTLSINGVDIPYDAFSNAYMKCAFWNGTSASTSPGTNGCYNTMLNVAPHIYNNLFSGNLDIQIITGRSCFPTVNMGQATISNNSLSAKYRWDIR